MKIILLCASLLLAVVSQAQAVFEIKSPPSISGYYTIGLGDSTSNPVWGNGSIATKSVEAELMLATGLDSLGKDALKADFNGKIAMIFRGGGVAFSDKALKAQEAGAVAVVIINHGMQSDGSVKPDDVYDFDPSTTGSQVKIPVIMISKNSYLKMSDLLRNNESIVGYIGKKQTFDYDLKLSNDFLIIPAKTTRTKSMVRQGMVSDTIGFGLINNGDKDQVNVGVSAVIMKGTDTLYYRALIFDTVRSKDTIGYYYFGDKNGILPFKPNDDLDTGRYELTFTVFNFKESTFEDTVVDQYLLDNVIKTNFYITDSVYSIANMKTYTSSTGKSYVNVPEVNELFKPGEPNYTSYSNCLVYNDKNLSNVEASSLTFYAGVSTGVLKDVLFKVSAYEWNNNFVDLRDTANFAFDSLNPLLDGQEFISLDSIKDGYQTVKFDQPIMLNTNQRYLFCLSTSDPKVYLGFDFSPVSLRPSIISVNRQPVYALEINKKFTYVGFGYNYIPSLSLSINTICDLSTTTSGTNESGVDKKDGEAKVEVSGGAAPFTYEWSTNPLQSNAIATGLSKGTYSVVVKDANNCIASDSVKIGVAALNGLNVSNLSVYPNPVAEQLNVSFTAKSNVTLMMTGITGNVIESKNVNGVVRTAFNTSNLSKGVYLITIKDNESSYSYKVVKE